MPAVESLHLWETEASFAAATRTLTCVHFPRPVFLATHGQTTLHLLKAPLNQPPLLRCIPSLTTIPCVFWPFLHQHSQLTAILKGNRSIVNPLFHPPSSPLWFIFPCSRMICGSNVLPALQKHWVTSLWLAVRAGKSPRCTEPESFWPKPCNCWHSRLFHDTAGLKPIDLLLILITRYLHVHLSHSNLKSWKYWPVM